MFTEFNRLLLEASVVGAGLVVLYMVVYLLTMLLTKDSTLKFGVLMVQLFVAGFAFHVICEYTNVNEWYCVNRPLHLRR